MTDQVCVCFWGVGWSWCASSRCVGKEEADRDEERVEMGVFGHFGWKERRLWSGEKKKTEGKDCFSHEELVNQITVA